MSTIEQSGRSNGAEGLAPLSQKAERRFKGVQKEFTKLAEKPMAGDAMMGAFYTAVGELTQTDPQFQSIIRNASRRRTTPDHLANLLLRGVQYVEIFENSRTSYDEQFKDPEAWKELLVGENGVVTNHAEKLEDILKNKETTTTKYPRYAGVKAALNAVFPNQDVKVADFGCGANYGLQGLRGDVPFPPIEVDLQDDASERGTERARRITGMIDASVSLEEGLAVDKTDPSGEEERKWRLACSFYPGELSIDNLRDLHDLEEKLMDINHDGMTFLQGDLLTLETNHADGTLPEARFDAVVMSTILYQMSKDQQMQMIDTAKKSLNDRGVIILQDFATKDDNPTGLKIEGLTPDPYSYRTFVMTKDGEEWNEFLQWESGRCKRVRPGADFDRVKPVTTPPTGPVDVYTAA
jgi:hypothetical protein